MARPIPRPAPVTTATFPSNSSYLGIVYTTTYLAISPRQKLLRHRDEFENEPIRVFEKNDFNIFTLTVAKSNQQARKQTPHLSPSDRDRRYRDL